MPLPPVVLGLGSNLGERAANLAQARSALGVRGYRILRESGIYETAPVGGPPQGPFLNQVVLGETSLAPEPLIEACLAIEAGLGRVRRERNGPRTLDIDILFYGNLVLKGELLIPHPRLHERRFVLVPLFEIAPELRHPILGASVSELLARCPDASAVAAFALAEPERR